MTTIHLCAVPNEDPIMSKQKKETAKKVEVRPLEVATYEDFAEAMERTGIGYEDLLERMVRFKKIPRPPRVQPAQDEACD